MSLVPVLLKLGTKGQDNRFNEISIRDKWIWPFYLNLFRTHPLFRTFGGHFDPQIKNRFLIRKKWLILNFLCGKTFRINFLARLLTISMEIPEIQHPWAPIILRNLKFSWKSEGHFDPMLTEKVKGQVNLSWTWEQKSKITEFSWIFFGHSICGSKFGLVIENFDYAFACSNQESLNFDR